MTQHYYRNRREPRKVPILRATWYYLGQLAEEMGMSTEEYAAFALQIHVQDNGKRINFDRKWTGQ
jgi:hypothetical protein